MRRGRGGLWRRRGSRGELDLEVGEHVADHRLTLVVHFFPEGVLDLAALLSVTQSIDFALVIVEAKARFVDSVLDFLGNFFALDNVPVAEEIAHSGRHVVPLIEVIQELLFLIRG
jgi:hypothetical protein